MFVTTAGLTEICDSLFQVCKVDVCRQVTFARTVKDINNLVIFEGLISANRSEEHVRM
jgi:hypothetical protein